MNVLLTVKGCFFNLTKRMKETLVYSQLSKLQFSYCTFNVSSVQPKQRISFSKELTIIHLDDSSLTMERNIITAINQYDWIVRLVGSKFVVVSSNVSNNYVKAFVYVDTKSILVMNQSLLLENQTPKDGSIVFAPNEGSYITISNCTMKNNRANGDGGVVHNGFNNITITDTLFSNNSAKKGGGVIHSLSKINIFNSVFIYNKALYGGALVIKSSLVLINTSFVENRALQNGSAISATASTQSDEVTLDHCIMEGNKAPSDFAMHLDSIHNLRTAECNIFGPSNISQVPIIVISKKTFPWITFFQYTTFRTVFTIGDVVLNSSNPIFIGEVEVLGIFSNKDIMLGYGETTFAAGMHFQYIKGTC